MYLVSYKYTPLLKDQTNQAPNQTDYEFKVKQWHKDIKNQIKLEEQRLISIKGLHTNRYRTRKETAVYETKYERG